MDRINGADTTDIGSGRRGFRAENLVAGVAGTEVTAEWLNSVQEEILRVVTEAGLTPDAADWSQLWQALKAFGLSSGSRSRRWMAVISMTLSSAPGSPTEGDAYLVPGGATGIWAAKVGQIAEWSGSVWTYFTPTDGHGIALPDGRIFERIGGVYTEFLASRSWVASRTAATTKLNRLPWLPVLSMTTAAPPASPAQGDTYLVPTGATGVWAANIGKIAEYLDGAWSYATPSDGHGIATPDGMIWIKISGVYTPTVITTPITKTVYGAGADFADLNAAHDWLSRFRIIGDGAVTLTVAAGKFAAPTLQYFSHVDGNRIVIEGAALINGGFPAEANFAATGTTAATRTADKATNLALLRNRFPTELACTGNGCVILGNVNGARNLLVTGDGTAVDGISVFSSPSITLQNIASGGFGGRGIVTALSRVVVINVAAVASGTTGVSAEEASTLSPKGAMYAIGNTGVGVSAVAGATIVAQLGGPAVLISKSNGSHGFSAVGNSRIQTAGNVNAKAEKNVALPAGMPRKEAKSARRTPFQTTMLGTATSQKMMGTSRLAVQLVPETARDMELPTNPSSLPSAARRVRHRPAPILSVTIWPLFKLEYETGC